VYPVKRLSLAIISLCFCVSITQASAQLTETIHSSCRFWLSTPEPEIVRTALDLCRQNLEDPLIDVVDPLYRRLEADGR
jgi:hypothetical protein